jgi:hypothetical protein
MKHDYRVLIPLRIPTSPQIANRATSNIFSSPVCYEKVIKPLRELVKDAYTDPF